MTMSAKDIPDQLFLDVVIASPAIGCWRMRWDVQSALQGLMRTDIPEKVFLAKARKLIRRGLMHGCDCGCRGDYHLPDERPYCC